MVADFLDVFHVVRGVEDAAVEFGADAEDNFADFVGDVGIETGGGFVEQEEFGFVEEGLAEVDAGGFAGGELAGDALVEVGDLHHFEEFGDAFFGFGDAVDFGEDEEVLPDEEVGGQGGVGGGEVGAAEDFDAVGLQFFAEGVEAAGGGEGEAEHAVHGGGLAGAVGTEQAEDLSAVELEAEFVQGFDAVELAGEVAGFEDDFAGDGGGHAGWKGARFGGVCKGGGDPDTKGVSGGVGCGGG